MNAQGPVLVVAAHPDDEVLGCGGTMARMSRDGRKVHVLFLADGETSRPSASGDTARVAERGAAARAAGKILGCASVRALDLPDNRLDGVELLTIVQHIEEEMRGVTPVTVLTHHAGDVNVDHRIVHEAVLAACRPQPGHSVKELLFFEVPSSTEWRPPQSAGPAAFAPNWFEDISATLAVKLEALRVYREELREFPHPRSERAVEALARWRGATVGLEAAEAFTLGRNIVTVGRGR